MTTQTLRSPADIHAWMPGATAPCSHVQELHLALLRCVRRGHLQGPRIADDLVSIRRHWVAVVIDNAGMLDLLPYRRLAKLRGLAAGIYDVDTLYVLAPGRSAAAQVATLAASWHPDHVEIVPPYELEEVLGGDPGHWLTMVRWGGA